MNIFNINVPKDRISMIFDAFGNSENYSTTLYLHKSKITFEEEGNKYYAQLEIDLKQDTKKDKMVKQIFNKEYGSFIITFLNADFSNAESAYNSFFIYYGLEGFDSIDKIKEKYPIEYTARYVSTKKFLDYYNKAYKYLKDKYIKFQKDVREIVDFVFNLHENDSCIDLDKYSKFIAFSSSVNLTNQFIDKISLKIFQSPSNILSEVKDIKQVEELAYDISNKKQDIGIYYVYESTSHFALAYVALNDLIQNSKRSISVCHNCGRYYLQSSGKEVYCELFNLDGSPSCKSYASRKAYDNKIVEDIAELAYKREYQRKITQVYRADKKQKEQIKKEFLIWKDKARKQLKLYRENKISKDEFCNWIEENK